MWAPQLNVKLPFSQFSPKEIHNIFSWVRFVVVVGDDQCDQIGQPFKAAGNNYFAQIAHILGNIWKCYKIFKSSSEISFGQLLYIDIWQLFTGHAVGDDANAAKKFRHLRRSEFLQKIWLAPSGKPPWATGTTEQLQTPKAYTYYRPL